MKSVFLILLLLNAGLAFSQVFEAENGALSGTQLATQRAGYTGTGYVTGFDNDGDKVTITVNAGRTGAYDLFFRYASPSGDKFNLVYINNQILGSAAFAMTGTFVETKAGKVFLNQGQNTIAVVKEWGYFELDNVRLAAAQPTPFNNIAAALVTPSPSHEADSLYDYLASLYGKVILSGQYGGTTEFEKINSISGKTPVIRGFDLIDYSPTRVQFGATSTEVEKAIAWHKEKKGIVTFCWHWNAPKDLINQPGKEWWRGFYTDATTFDVTRAMNNPSGEEFTLILRDIDAIAVQLKRLQAENIPILWRPLHEAEGAWFWWGAKGATACKWLWQLVYNRLVNHHGINNLIWTWTSSDKQTAIDWYPGDQYVDMIGADIYMPAGNHGSNFMMFDNLARLFEGRKMIAMTENGPMPDPERMFVEGAAWSWFATWEGTFIMDGVSNPTSHINTVFTHDYVITLDEIDGMDEIIEALEVRRDEMEETVTNIGEDVPGWLSYQNPVRNTLKLHVNSAHSSEITVFSVNGKQEAFPLRSEMKNHFEIDFTPASEGIYVIKVVNKEFTRVFRVLKKN